MNCAICKNPILNSDSYCEWCGANLNHNIDKIDDKILELVTKKKNLLAAVKLYRIKTGCSLKEARDYVNKIKNIL